METLKGLVDAVDRLIDTCCLEKADIVSMLNRQQLLIAGGGERSYGIPTLPPLPELHDIFNATAFSGKNSTVIPGSYHRGDGDLLWVNGTGEHIETVDNLKGFYKKSSVQLGKTGKIELCCINGRKLHYVNSPSTDTTLSFHGYRFPTDMSRDSDNPDGIPPHLQYPLLVNGSVYVFYNFIDQDMNKPLHNISKHKMFFDQALSDLQVWIQDSNGSYNIEGCIDNFQ